MQDDTTGVVSTTTQTCRREPLFGDLPIHCIYLGCVFNARDTQRWVDTVKKLRQYRDPTLRQSKFFCEVRGLVRQLNEHYDHHCLRESGFVPRMLLEADVYVLRDAVDTTLKKLHESMEHLDHWALMRKLPTETLAQGHRAVDGKLNVIPVGVLDTIAAIAGDPRGHGVSDCLDKHRSRRSDAEVEIDADPAKEEEQRKSENRILSIFETRTEREPSASVQAHRPAGVSLPK